MKLGSPIAVAPVGAIPSLSDPESWNMLRNESIAARLQLSTDDLNELMQGSVTPAVAAQLGMRRTDLQLFVEGQATDRIVRDLRMGTLDAACEFAASLGRTGGIGVLFGLLLSATDPGVVTRHAATEVPDDSQ